MEFPIIRGHEDNYYELVEDYKINGFTIKKGMKTDGLTMKIRALNLFVHKFSPKFSPFFVLHDDLTNKGFYDLADKKGGEVLYELEDSFRTKSMMFFIRSYHKLKKLKGKIWT